MMAEAAAYRATPHAIRVLLVEDEPVLRELTADILAEAGYHVTEAGDGTSAMDMLQSEARIDLLLSDIRLPGADGYELAAAGFSLRPRLKVVLMTGYAPTPLPAQLHDRVHTVLQKPFAIDSLPEAIAAAFASA